MTLKSISGLWIGTSLSYIEQLCIRSFIDAGHSFHLYTYGPVMGVDEDVEVRDAAEILPIDGDPSRLTYDEVEIVADRFKYMLLQQQDTIWTDLDMYCLRPWDFEDDYVLSWQKGTRVVGGAVFAAPKDSEFLTELVKLSQDPTPVPPWYPEEEQEELRSLIAQGKGKSVDELNRGAIGVHAISHFTKQLDLTEHVYERQTFFPCDFSEREALTNPEDELTGNLGDGYGVHLWGRRLRRSVMSGEMRIPPATSFFGKVLVEHGISIVEAETDNQTPDGLIKQNTAIDQLDYTELRRAMAELEKKAEQKFERLPLPDDAPDEDPDFLIVSAMKNEGAFVLEWIAYHLSIGVKHFLVYTNDCIDGTDEILNRLGEMGYVTRLDNPFKKDKGQKPQRGALNDAIEQKVWQDADWTMCIDVDEFINVHVGDGTIGALLKAANYPNLVSLTWKLFGNDKVDEFEDRFICEQFLNCAPEYLPKPRLGWGFKTMFSKAAPYGKLGVHRPLHPIEERIDEARWVNGSGRMMPEMLLTNNGWRSTKRSIGYSLATLNHYVLRSAESYLVKRERGRINHVDQDQGIGYWQARNYITDTDDRILEHLPRAKKRYDELMADPTLADLQAKAVAWHKARIKKLRADPDYAVLYERLLSDDPLAEKQEEDYAP